VQPVAKTLPDTGRVFVTHGSNKEIVEQIKDILTFGKFEPVVSVQMESTAKPVPDKVMGDMRGCYAAIVHVGTEKVLRDEDGNEVKMLNPNVLIEIGAAMALYGRRFVLLVEKGITLPSNLRACTRSDTRARSSTTRRR
jgi:predicted nucleotide-binding protein